MSDTTESSGSRFSRIVSEHGAALARLAGAYAFDASDRDDLLQEILLGIWLALPRFRGDSSERTFVFRIGHNQGITHRRRRRPLGAIDEAERLPDERPDPASAAALQDERERLEAAIRQLPEGSRHVVTLSLEGLSQREIAAVIGIQENAVAARLSRARRALAELLTGGRV